ncbi:Relaxase/mobilization nuclease family protein [Neorhizobium galegae bv. officinalis]|nr:Relaxase/mobilization nuclease family protein [Neorhizobium galegae bv. officinalis]
MEKNDIEELRARVGCAAVLEHEGFAINRKGSTRRAIKFRRDDDVIIVIHDDRGWFDARSDAKGDVFALASYLHGIGFAEALAAVGDLVAFQPTKSAWERPLRQKETVTSITDRWSHRKRPWRASATWRYLHQCRALPWHVISAAIEADVLREGPYGSMWAKHVDEAGAVIGWEERGSDWRGFSTGGAKALFQFGMNNARRICVTEAAIDALSLAAIEETRSDTLYLSTGGGWSPLTALALETLASGEDAWLVAATDNDVQGEVFADRLRQMADSAHCNFSRLRPRCEDWNEELKLRRERGELPHTREAASRVKLSPA